MAPRLLSILSQVQNALIEQGVAGAQHPIQRSVSYHKGLARMMLEAGGSISLQTYSLADGQTCVKASLMLPGRTDAVIHSIYPRGPTHDWRASAEGIALAWVAATQGAIPNQADVISRDEIGAERLATVVG
ncbi:MAG: hypothetical protein K1X42_05715 [Opitutaceae bacterium]|nr:hypothetical protein [Opitutaceae bacterium]